MFLTPLGRRSSRPWHLFVLFFACLLSVLAPGCSGGGEPPPTPVEQVVVSDVYRRFQSYAEDKSLKLELDDFRTLSTETMKATRWVDMVTMPGGYSVDTVVSKRVDDRGTHASFTTSWNPDVEMWADSDEAMQYGGVTVAEALSQAGAEEPDLAKVSAITNFRVRVTLSGITREYRAAFLWLGSVGSAPSAFLIIDNIVQGLADAALLKDTPETAPVREPQRRALSPAAKECVPSELRLPSPSSDVPENKISAQIDLICTCGAQCDSTCSAVLATHQCEGKKKTLKCRKQTPSFSFKPIFVGDGDTEGANCAAAYACAVKWCLFCLCANIKITIGISVPIHVGGSDGGGGITGSAGATITYDYDPDKGIYKWEHTPIVKCPKCERKNTPMSDSGVGSLSSEAGRDATSVGVSCGDQVCTPGAEDCGVCPGDCPCPTGQHCDNRQCVVDEAPCGDKICTPGKEDCGTCPGDCPCPGGKHCENRQCADDLVPCGDKVCTPGMEDCGTCPGDCPCPSGQSCVNRQCQATVACGDKVCTTGMEDCGTCPGDCPCPSGQSCVNRQCQVTVACGDKVCTTGMEDCGTCPGDCPCPGGKHCENRQCVNDAVPCGDKVCTTGMEDCGTCPGDCPCPGGQSCVNRQCQVTVTCGDKVCTPGMEDCGTCPGDCPCPGGQQCVNRQCKAVVGVMCGDNVCTPGMEDCGTCLADCPCPTGQSCVNRQCVMTPVTECTPGEVRACSLRCTVGINCTGAACCVNMGSSQTCTASGTWGACVVPPACLGSC